MNKYFNPNGASIGDLETLESQGQMIPSINGHSYDRVFRNDSKIHNHPHRDGAGSQLGPIKNSYAASIQSQLL